MNTSLPAKTPAHGLHDLANQVRDTRLTTPEFFLIMMSDKTQLPNFEDIIAGLPRGVCVLFRDYLDTERAVIAKRLKTLCAAQGCTLLVAGDPDLARAVHADGIHVPSWQLRHRGRWAGFSGVITAACHNIEEVRLATKGGADAIIASPVFQTQSHPGQKNLSVQGFRALAARSSVPVFGLGGITAQNAALLRGPNVAGFAAISAFAQ